MSKRFYVYAMLCQDGNSGPGYVKFGKSCNVGARLSALRVSCPVPARYFAVVEVRNDQKQSVIEKDLHEIFAPRKITGEWFSFDFHSKTDKEDFHAGCKAIFNRHVTGIDQKYWTFVNVKALDADSDEVKSKIARFGGFSKINLKSERARKQNRAWRELDKYGT